MTTPTDNTALVQALAEYEAAQRGYHDYFSNARGDVLAAFTVYVLEDAADAAIRALQADNAAKAERLREAEATHKRELQSLKHVFQLWQSGDILIASGVGLEGIHLLKVYLEETGVIGETGIAQQDDAAAPILYELDFDAYADWYRQTTGRDTPFEAHQLFTIEHNMGKVASEDYVYVHVASVPGCSMPRRFLKAWAPEPDDAADG